VIENRLPSFYPWPPWIYDRRLFFDIHFSGGSMDTKPELAPDEQNSSIAAGIFARSAQIILGFVLLVTLLFLASGRLGWNWAWVFLGIYGVTVLINGTFMLRTNRETLAERGQPAEIKGWDKIVSGIWTLGQYILLPLAAGLDVRFGWTPVLSLDWHIFGAVVFAFGLGFFSWAMIKNAFFSTAVRIQSDRGHRVCRSGPYQFVRHPGYLGVIFQSLGAPILLGSLWALIPGALAMIAIIIRTSLEDQTLLAGLPGYKDFAQEVRYRLIPGVW
jgi:protein-S-isoprenylcysteine O-methyltransferase Ste14